MDWLYTRINFIIAFVSMSNIKYIYDIQRYEIHRIYNNYVLNKSIMLDLIFMFLFIILFLYNSLSIYINYKRYILYIRRDNNLINITFGDITTNIAYISELENCSICLENYKLTDNICKLKKCIHVFHAECIKTWFNSSKTLSCPLCR
jgi:hypothetical protein